MSLTDIASLLPSFVILRCGDSEIPFTTSSKRSTIRRWVLTEKVIQGKQDFKAKLVVQVCQEDRDAPIGSRDIERLLLLRIPHRNPPSGTKEWQVFAATGSIYGTRHAGRGWYEHSKKVLEPAGFVESKL